MMDFNEEQFRYEITAKIASKRLENLNYEPLLWPKLAQCWFSDLAQAQPSPKHKSPGPAQAQWSKLENGPRPSPGPIRLGPKWPRAEKFWPKPIPSHQLADQDMNEMRRLLE